ncbi:hypothetical protein ACVBAX_21540 [Robertmurraya sp. GLU-23]
MAIRSNNKVLIEDILSEEFILDKNYVFNYRIQEAIARDNFQESEVYPYPQSKIENPEEGMVSLVEKRKLTPFIKKEESKSIEWNLLMSKTIMDLDEYTGDVFDVVRVLWTEQKQKDSSGMISLTVDDILQFRQESPHKHLADGTPVYHKQKRIKAMQELTKLFSLTLSLGRKVEDVEVDPKTGVVLNISETEEVKSLFYIGDYKMYYENDEPLGFEQVYVRPGNILMENLLLEEEEDKSNMRLMSQQALKYHFKHQVYHKRLTRYLNLAWDLNKKLKQISLYSYPISGEKGLLSVMGLEITNNRKKKPSVFLEEFTRILEDLREDGVIGSWRYGTPDGELDPELLNKRGWLFDYFLKQRVIITPPKNIAPFFKVEEEEVQALQSYLSVASEVESVIKGDIPLTPRILANVKDKLDLSDRQLAKVSKVSQPTISRLMTDESTFMKLRKNTKERLLEWLSSVLPVLEK